MAAVQAVWSPTGASPAASRYRLISPSQSEPVGAVDGARPAGLAYPMLLERGNAGRGNVQPTASMRTPNRPVVACPARCDPRMVGIALIRPPLPLRHDASSPDRRPGP